MSRLEITRAGELHRNARVYRDATDGQVADNFPYLVDSVGPAEYPARCVKVTYSSGDVVTYGETHPLVTVADN